MQHGLTVVNRCTQTADSTGIKEMRVNQAGILTKQINKGKCMDEGCSKET